MARKSPAFSCYPKDLLGDSKVAMMSNEEFGAYWRLCCYSWEEGSIPADLGDLALMLPRTTKKQMERMWRIIGRCFKPHDTENGRLVQPRLEEERQKQALHREKQADNGRKGGRPHKPNDNPTETQKKAVGFSGLSETEAKKSLSSSSSSSSVANATSSEGGERRLPLVDETTVAAKAILSAVWPKVETSVAGAMTKTEWGKRNMRYARDLVAAGASIDAILAAHASASRRLGKTVQMLSIVQNELAAKNDKPASPYANLRVVGKDA